MNYNNDDKRTIEDLFYDLVSIQSDTGTALEKNVENYIYDWFIKRPYFLKNPSLVGKYKVEDDPLEREVNWALVKGKSNDTIILLNHHDIVDIYEYGDLIDVALKPRELMKRLREMEMPNEIKIDLESEDWIFGRGTCDMKAGTAIQMWLTDKISRIKDFNGSILFLSVSDEENLSIGMRGAVNLLTGLRDKHSLNYKCFINSEPYVQDDDRKGIIFEGTVGKCMPVIYVRGIKSHIGDVYSGFNPSYLLSCIHKKVELNTDFSDVVAGEASPPPTWIYVRDRKKCYDVSIPESAAAYFSVLSLYTTPMDIMNELRKLSSEAFQECIIDMNNSYKAYCNKINENFTKLPWKPKVIAYNELLNKVIEQKGNVYEEKYNSLIDDLNNKIAASQVSVQEATLNLIEELVEQIENKEPMVVLSFSIPFYPSISNRDLGLTSENEFLDIINNISNERFNRGYKKEDYFMGICDFSYTGLLIKDSVIKTIEDNTPGWNKLYSIPFDKLKTLSVPMVNIGPWGKDLHMTTERVNKTDVFERIPQIMFDFTMNLLNRN